MLPPAAAPCGRPNSRCGLLLGRRGRRLGRSLRHSAAWVRRPRWVAPRRSLCLLCTPIGGRGRPPAGARETVEAGGSCRALCASALGSRQQTQPGTDARSRLFCDPRGPLRTSGAYRALSGAQAEGGAGPSGVGPPARPRRRARGIRITQGGRRSKVVVCGQHVRGQHQRCSRGRRRPGTGAGCSGTERHKREVRRGRRYNTAGRGLPGAETTGTSAQQRWRAAYTAAEAARPAASRLICAAPMPWPRKLR